MLSTLTWVCSGGGSSGPVKSIERNGSSALVEENSIVAKQKLFLPTFYLLDASWRIRLHESISASMITEVLVAKAEIKTTHGSCRFLVIIPLQKTAMMQWGSIEWIIIDDNSATLTREIWAPNPYRNLDKPVQIVYLISRSHIVENLASRVRLQGRWVLGNI